MARPKKDKEIIEQVLDEKVNSMDQIDEILNAKENKGRHYGSVSGDQIKAQPTVSTGSLMFDYALSQGMPAGSRGYKAGTFARACGPEQTGKTSEGLVMAREWAKTMPNPKIVIFNGEGRIFLEMLQRLSVDTSKERFRMINSNVGEFVFGTQETLIANNPEGYNYFFLTDSSDSLSLENDLKKGLDEAQKIAAGALLASVACKRLALPLLVGSHFSYITSQLRSKIGPSMPGMGPTSAPSGGNALKYYNSLTITFKKPWSETFIYTDPNDKKSRRIGANVNLVIDKSYNEINGLLVSYPVKYGSSVWKSLELMNLCLAWNLLTLTGRTYTFAESFRSDVHDKGFDLPDKVVGMPALIEFFDTNPDFIKIGENIFENLLFGTGEKKINIPLADDEVE